MATDPISRVVVIGGGSAGLLSALTLKRMLPELSVTVVHSSASPTIGVGESTTSLIPAFLHQGLGLASKAFYKSVRPTWKLGIRFDWGAPGADDFYYPFDQPLEARSKPLGKENAYYCFADGRVVSPYTVMMTETKSPYLPQPDGNYQINHQYGYHVENQAFFDYLTSQLSERDISLRDGEIRNVDLAADGTIDSIQLEDGNSLAADLFIDCTGLPSRLLGKELEEPFLDYGNSLFSDTAVTGSWHRDQGVLPYTTCETMDHGWSWQIELADRVDRGYVYSSQFCAEEDAIREMRADNPLMGDDFGSVKFRSGRYERFWVGNVAAIGNASGFVEPLESTGLHMIAVTARTLGQALVDTDRQVSRSLQREINRYIGRMWDDIRDFLAVHFKFNRQRDTPFWRHCRAETDLAGAQRLIDFYRENGPSSMGGEFLPNNSVFRLSGYLTLLIGLQVASDYEFHPPPDDQRTWSRIREQIHRQASQAFPMDEGLAMILRQAQSP